MTEESGEMTAPDVISLYRELRTSGIEIWIDGGWSVDALLGKQLRNHKDLDIAVEWKNVPLLREVLAFREYIQVREDSK